MKKIEAIIRPNKLDSVRQALIAAGTTGLMVTKIEGHGSQKGLTKHFRGKDYTVDLLPKSKIEVIVKDNEVDNIVEVISVTARTGEIGDGKIFVYPAENAIRIRTGEKGEGVL